MGSQCFAITKRAARPTDRAKVFLFTRFTLPPPDAPDVDPARFRPIPFSRNVGGIAGDLGDVSIRDDSKGVRGDPGSTFDARRCSTSVLAMPSRALATVNSSTVGPTPERRKRHLRSVGARWLAPGFSHNSPSRSDCIDVADLRHGRPWESLTRKGHTLMSDDAGKSVTSFLAAIPVR